jgi:hypothetical protein
MDTDLQSLAKRKAQYFQIEDYLDVEMEFADEVHIGKYIVDAVTNDYPLTLQWMFDRNVWLEYDDDLVGIAVDNGHVDILDVLLESEYECDTQIKNAFTRAVFYGQTKVLDWLVGKVEWKCQQRVLVFIAIREDQFEALEWLTTNGATLDEDATACAVHFESPEMLQWLLARGVARNPENQTKSRNRVTKCLAEHLEDPDRSDRVQRPHAFYLKGQKRPDPYSD